jgi:Fe-S cluster assembly protein SufD
MGLHVRTLDVFDPSTYPTRRDEEWKYSDLSRHLRGLSQDPTFAPKQSDKVTEITAGQKVVQIVQLTNGGVSNEVLHYRLGEGAQFIRIVILDEPDDAVSIYRSTLETAANCVFKQYVFSTGAAFQRFETHVHHVGQGAYVELNGAYLLKGKSHFDYTTRVTHAGLNGTTAQLIKGLVKDQATAVFQGRILVEQGADGTDARMQHQALMLNDGAHIRAKPELEIYADDVQCAHGNTIGAMDEAALFYCQSRGLSELQARQLLMHAFLSPVVELIEEEGARQKVSDWLDTQAGGFYAF